MKEISRQELNEMIADGRKFVLAGLYERQDYLVRFHIHMKKPVREVTNEPNHWDRKLIEYYQKGQ